MILELYYYDKLYDDGRAVPGCMYAGDLQEAINFAIMQREWHRRGVSDYRVRLKAWYFKEHFYTKRPYPHWAW